MEPFEIIFIGLLMRIISFPNCGLWKAYHSYLIKKPSPLGQGIMEGENPVLDLIKYGQVLCSF